MICLKGLIKRTYTKIFSDKFSIIVCLVLPIAFSILFHFLFLALKKMLGVQMWDQTLYGPGPITINACCLSFCFASMFLASLLINDKKNSMILRVKMAPISYCLYIFSYLLCVGSIMIVQIIINMCLALCMGMAKSPIHFLVAIAYFLPAIILFIVFGLFLGEMCSNQMQSSLISIFVFLVSFVFSSFFLPIHLFAESSFAKMVNYLPFEHCALLVRNIYTENAFCLFGNDILYVLVYTAIFLGLFLFIHFLRRNKFSYAKEK